MAHRKFGTMNLLNFSVHLISRTSSWKFKCIKTMPWHWTKNIMEAREKLESILEKFIMEISNFTLNVEPTMKPKTGFHISISWKFYVSFAQKFECQICHLKKAISESLFKSLMHERPLKWRFLIHVERFGSHFLMATKEMHLHYLNTLQWGTLRIFCWSDFTWNQFWWIGNVN